MRRIGTDGAGGLATEAHDPSSPPSAVGPLRRTGVAVSLRRVEENEEHVVSGRAAAVPACTPCQFSTVELHGTKFVCAGKLLEIRKRFIEFHVQASAAPSR